MTALSTPIIKKHLVEMVQNNAANLQKFCEFAA